MSKPDHDCDKYYICPNCNTNVCSICFQDAVTANGSCHICNHPVSLGELEAMKDEIYHTEKIANLHSSEPSQDSVRSHHSRPSAGSGSGVGDENKEKTYSGEDTTKNVSESKTSNISASCESTPQKINYPKARLKSSGTLITKTHHKRRSSAGEIFVSSIIPHSDVGSVDQRISASHGTSGASKNSSVGSFSEESLTLEYKEKRQSRSRPFQASVSPSQASVSSDSTSSFSKMKQSALENESRYSSHASADIFDIPTTDEFITFTTEVGTTSKIIKCCSLEKCLQYITSKEFEDTYFLQCFVYTYKLITSTTELLRLLMILFSPIRPNNVSWEDFAKNYLFPLRAKILAIVKMLIQLFPTDFEEEENQQQMIELIQMFHVFNPDLGKVLSTTLKNASSPKKHQQVATKDANRLPADTKVSGMFCFSPHDFAEQLTLLQMNLFMKIPPTEFLNQSWTKKNKSELAPQLLEMIHFSNKIIHIVQTQIIRQPSYPLRSLALFYFIHVADSMRKIQNFDGMKAVITALQSVAVYRLKVSWEILPQKTKDLFKGLVVLVSEDNNFAELRKKMKIVTPPTIPFIGSTLTDLIYTSDGNETTCNTQYNFYKLRGLGNLIKEIQIKQKTPFPFYQAPNLQMMINTLEIITDEESLYKMSEAREPKPADKVIDITKKPYKGEAKDASSLLKSYLKKIKMLR
ncbi:Ras guanine nucleotide exchange factor [Entamoeba marina]